MASASKRYLLSRVKRIDRRLGRSLRDDRAFVHRIDPLLAKFADAEKDFVLSGGKRLRGVLAVLGYEWHGGTNAGGIDTVAAAIEILHAGLLVHDDIIDRDTHRRGRKTLHETRMAPHGGGAHEDLSFAILAGDHLATLGYRLLLEAQFPLDRKFKAIRVFHEEGLKTGSGALLELDAARGASASKERLERTQRLKTASYSTLAPFRIGAALAGKTVQPAMKRLLTDIGEAFQLRDDAMSLMQTRSQTGKTAFSDLREGRQNPLLSKMRLLLPPAERREFDAFLRGAAFDMNVRDIVRMLEKHGLEGVVKEEIDGKWEGIAASIAKMPAPATKKELLIDIANMHVYRVA